MATVGVLIDLRRARPKQGRQRVERRGDNGRHDSSLLKNSRNRNRRNAYDVSGRHSRIAIVLPTQLDYRSCVMLDQGLRTAILSLQAKGHGRSLDPLWPFLARLPCGVQQDREELATILP